MFPTSNQTTVYSQNQSSSTQPLISEHHNYGTSANQFPPTLQTGGGGGQVLIDANVLAILQQRTLLGSLVTTTSNRQTLQLSEGEFVGTVQGDHPIKGVLTYKTGNNLKRVSYDGEFEDNLPNGKGIMIWVTGERYEGDFKRGLKHGNGKISYPQGKISVYDGEWQEGKMHGQGKYYYENGGSFTGLLKNEIANGKGVFYTADGVTTEGNMVNDVMEGQTTIKYPDGRVYQGKMVGGKKEGDWTCSNAKGEVSFSYYEQGEYKGCCKCTIM